MYVYGILVVIGGKENPAVGQLTGLLNLMEVNYG